MNKCAVYNHRDKNMSESVRAHTHTHARALTHIDSIAGVIHSTF